MKQLLKKSRKKNRYKRNYRNIQKRSLILFDWILILGIVGMMYIIAEEFLYKMSETGKIPIWIVALFFFFSCLIGLLMLRRNIIRNKIFDYFVRFSLISGMLLSIYVLIEELVYYIAEKGHLGGWEVATIILVLLVFIGVFRYIGKEKKFVKRVSDNL